MEELGMAVLGRGRRLELSAFLKLEMDIDCVRVKFNTSLPLDAS